MAQIITHILSKTNTNSNEKIFHKINCDNGVTYYISDAIPLAGTVIENADMLQLLRFSNYAINRKTNELIKCREPLENLVDAFLRTL